MARRIGGRKLLSLDSRSRQLHLSITHSPQMFQVFQWKTIARLCPNMHRLDSVAPALPHGRLAIINPCLQEHTVDFRRTHLLNLPTIRHRLT